MSRWRNLLGHLRAPPVVTSWGGKSRLKSLVCLKHNPLGPSERKHPACPPCVYQSRSVMYRSQDVLETIAREVKLSIYEGLGGRWQPKRLRHWGQDDFCTTSSRMVHTLSQPPIQPGPAPKSQDFFTQLPLSPKPLFALGQGSFPSTFSLLRSPLMLNLGLQIWK